MSKIDALIERLCPDGVPRVRLGDAVKITRGVRVIKSQLASVGEYPVYQNCMTPLGYYDKSNYPADTVFIISAGAAGEVGYSFVDFWAADDCFCFSCPRHMQSRFLYYALLCQQGYLFSQVRRASVPRLARLNVEQLQIPVPPLDVQEEIVKILDTFTALEAELEAELEARKQQYAYYRGELLSFNESPKIEIKKTAKMQAGKNITASNISQEQNAEFCFPCYGGNGLRGYVRNASHAGTYVLIGRQGALCGNVKRVCSSFYATEHAVVFEASDMVNIDWAYHMLTGMNLNQYATKSAQPGLAVGTLEKLKFSLPPLEEQQRIVAILDKFDAIVNDLSSGLPAEIAARRQQYEHYRNKLLTFKELA